MSKLAKALTAAAGNAGGTLGYVEDVFSTYLYTGNGSVKSIDNGIDLAGEGGLVWVKNRGSAQNHVLTDTLRGDGTYLSSNTTAGNTSGGGIFLGDGFAAISSSALTNASNNTYASWTFRKAEKFFDVVTYTGDGAARTITHNLGSTPACMIIKRTDSTGDWWTYHSSLTTAQYLRLNTTGSVGSSAAIWNDTAPTDSVFSLGNSVANTSGGSFVAYLFASDAGGFGDDGSESIIKCGGVTTGNVSTDVEVDLGFEPQWILMKNAESASQWFLVDVMRGWVSPTGTTNQAKPLFANLSNSESTGTNFVKPTATGFTVVSDNLGDSQDWIYIAIRRPMKTPESGTEVFALDTAGSTGDGLEPTFRASFPVDAYLQKYNVQNTGNTSLAARLTGKYEMYTNSTTTEQLVANYWDYSNGVIDNTSTNANWIGLMFKRATGFFDVVAYTGTGVATTQAHNLGVVPEMMIMKSRSNASDWVVYHSALGNGTQLNLNTSNPAPTSSSADYWNLTTPTDSVFTLGSQFRVNGSSRTYIAYLFATLAGVSKVGSYTGTGSNVDVDCGFSAGARFILIKRTDSSGDWYWWDSLRGIVAGNDPYLLLNSTAAEVTSTDYIDPLASGFTVTSSAPAALNASGGNYIFLAIA